MKTQQSKERPASAIFADGAKRARPLALHPDAMGVSYPTRALEELSAEVHEGVAVLCVEGPLEHKGEGAWCWWQSYENLAIDFKSLLEDGAVQSIVLKFDSPGGECAGLNETVALMQRLKTEAGKPVYGYVDEACYSAAYALAMVCDELYMPASAGVGSIGVITAMSDVTKMNEKMGVRVEVIASGTKKTDGHPYVPLSEGAIKRTQNVVDKLAASFFGIVSAARGLSVETVQGFQAGTFTGQDAVDAGLVDGIMSLEECLTFARIPRTTLGTAAPMQQEKEPKKMAAKLAAAKALKDAQTALDAAKTDKDRALAAAQVVAAEQLVAKVKKTKTVTTDTHEEEIDDGEEDCAEEPMPPADDEEDDSESDDEEAASASVSGSTVKASVGALLDLARKLTGKHSIDQVMGALQGTYKSAKASASLASEVAAMKAEREREKLSAAIVRGQRDGKLAPSQLKWARTQSVAGLNAFLEAAPKLVHTASEEHTESAVEGVQTGAVSAEMAKIWKKQGFAEKDFPALLAKYNQNHKTIGAR